MQHLDEGTIHSWLDGALSADEAARVEAHVAECPQCATAVAEARGFIAASSRILTALDHVPRGIVPAPSPVKWYNRPAWRAAAAVLVVAVGSLVVVRNSDRKAAIATAQSDTIGTTNATATQARIVAPSPEGAPMRKPTVTAPIPPSTRTVRRSGVASSGRPSSESDFSGKAIRGAAPTKGVARERATDERVDPASGGNAVAATQAAGAMMAAPQPAFSSRLPGATMMDAVASEESPLKVVDTPRVLGAKVTLYEVAPGDTVTFTEVSNLRLEGVAVTGVATAELQARRSMQKSAAAAPTQPASQSAAAPPLQVEIANGVTSISWPDATTGNMLKLSGRMSVERLKEIKRRIEQERAAAAAKKSP